MAGSHLGPGALAVLGAETAGNLNMLIAALEPFAKIRHAVGDKMDVMLECHSLWNLPTAIKIAKTASKTRG